MGNKPNCPLRYTAPEYMHWAAPWLAQPLPCLLEAGHDGICDPDWYTAEREWLAARGIDLEQFILGERR